MPLSVTKKQIIDFIFNVVNKRQRNRITETINTDAVTKEMYLFEKRKYDIERYLDNEMSIGERCEIEELIKINPRLYEQFTLRKGINESIKIELFKEQLNKIHSELYNSDYNYIEHEKPGHKVSLVKDIVHVRKLKHNVLRIGKWVAAASILLLVCFSVSMYFTNRDSLQNRLYAKYYEPLTEKRLNFFKSSSLNKAKNKYFSKEYDVALMLLENLPNSMTIEVEKQLYYGLTLMELKRFDEAIDTFEHISINNKYKVIKPIIHWHLALCYLKTGNQEKAKELFEKIVQRNDSHYKEAKKILKKLNK